MPTDPTTGPPPWTDACRLLGERIDKLEAYSQATAAISETEDVEGLRLAIVACGARIDLIVEKSYSARINQIAKRLDEIEDQKLPARIESVVMGLKQIEVKMDAIIGDMRRTEGKLKGLENIDTVRRFNALEARFKSFACDVDALAVEWRKIGDHLKEIEKRGPAFASKRARSGANAGSSGADAGSGRPVGSMGKGRSTDQAK